MPPDVINNADGSCTVIPENCGDTDNDTKPLKPNTDAIVNVVDWDEPAEMVRELGDVDMVMDEGKDEMALAGRTVEKIMIEASITVRMNFAICIFLKEYGKSIEGKRWFLLIPKILEKMLRY